MLHVFHVSRIQKGSLFISLHSACVSDPSQHSRMWHVKHIFNQMVHVMLFKQIFGPALGILILPTRLGGIDVEISGWRVTRHFYQMPHCIQPQQVIRLQVEYLTFPIYIREYAISPPLLICDQKSRSNNTGRSCSA